MGKKVILSEILAETEAHCRKVMDRDIPKECFYHSLDHTLMVVEACKEIASGIDISKDERTLLLISAWFHDLGYKDTMDGKDHESISAEEAHQFLTDQGLDIEKIRTVEQCILDTKMPQNPKSKLGEILCDADMIHLGKEGFMETSAKLQVEMAQVKDKALDDRTWLDMNVAFMEAHHYITDYAKQNFDLQKKKNLKEVKKRLKKLNKENKKDEVVAPTKGIETLFRVTLSNHMQLSAIADNKANIMISVNSIILSVLVSVLIRKLGEFPEFILPAMLLTITCLAAIVFAILATRPNVSEGKFTRDDIYNRRINLMFFGNFHGMELDEYEWAMKEMMKDYDYLYSTMIRDVYFLGRVLSKKYRLLRSSYTVFMIGLVVSIVSFLIAGLLMERVG